MPNQKNKDVELLDLMNYIYSNYTKEDIDWYLSLVPQPKEENSVEIKVSSNSYADEK